MTVSLQDHKIENKIKSFKLFCIRNYIITFALLGKIKINSLKKVKLFYIQVESVHPFVTNSNGCRIYVDDITGENCRQLRFPRIKGRGLRRSLFQPATEFTLLQNMTIWCKIQVIIHPFKQLSVLTILTAHPILFYFTVKLQIGCRSICSNQVLSYLSVVKVNLQSLLKHIYFKNLECFF